MKYLVCDRLEGHYREKGPTVLKCTTCDQLCHSKIGLELHKRVHMIVRCDFVTNLCNIVYLTYIYCK
jgi:hypothetical protein